MKATGGRQGVSLVAWTLKDLCASPRPGTPDIVPSPKCDENHEGF